MICNDLVIQKGVNLLKENTHISWPCHEIGDLHVRTEKPLVGLCGCPVWLATPLVAVLRSAFSRGPTQQLWSMNLVNGESAYIKRTRAHARLQSLVCACVVRCLVGKLFFPHVTPGRIFRKAGSWNKSNIPTYTLRSAPTPILQLFSLFFSFFLFLQHFCLDGTLSVTRVQ